MRSETKAYKAVANGNGYIAGDELQQETDFTESPLVVERVNVTWVNFTNMMLLDEAPEMSHVVEKGQAQQAKGLVADAN